PFARSPLPGSGSARQCRCGAFRAWPSCRRTREGTESMWQVWNCLKRRELDYGVTATIKLDECLQPTSGSTPCHQRRANRPPSPASWPSPPSTQQVRYGEELVASDALGLDPPLGGHGCDKHVVSTLGASLSDLGDCAANRAHCTREGPL
ncbi:unnamed protein product, partial [Ectocarpus sp. 13 AM-2016]